MCHHQESGSVIPILPTSQSKDADGPYQQSLHYADLPPQVVFDDTRADAMRDQ
jgi:hypothetical protein